MKIENVEVYGIDAAVRSMRNPMNSWDKNDTVDGELGPNDLKLATRLVGAGTEHRKFLRSIYVTVDLTLPQYICAELDTYKVGTVRNSCSFMHKGVSKKFEIDDFTTDRPEDLTVIIEMLNHLRDLYLKTKDYKYFRRIRQILPMGYNYKFTWTANYEVLLSIYFQRRNHRLKEWHPFCDWIKELPYMQDFINAIENK